MESYLNTRTVDKTPTVRQLDLAPLHSAYQHAYAHFCAVLLSEKKP